MYTVYRKGQGTIAEMFIFYTIIMTNMVIMFIMIAGGGTFTQEVEPAINYELGDVKAESTVTATTNDYLWRSDQIDYGEYDFKLANELMSIYFSTPGDTVYFGEREVDKSTLGDDLETYMDYKMQKYWSRGPNPTNYWLEITYQSGGTEETLEVSRPGYQPAAEDSKRSFPVALTNGEIAQASLWIESGEGIYSVSDVPDVGSP
jgi:hypothetical protein